MSFCGRAKSSGSKLEGQKQDFTHLGTRVDGRPSCGTASFLGQSIGSSGTQWLILTALFELDQEGDGVPVNAVSKKTLVQSNFVTTQSKILEKKGLLRRRRSGDDARIVQLSLTDRAYKAMAALSSRHKSLNEFIFAELNERQLEELTNALTSLDNRFQKAGLKLLVGI